MTPRIGSAALLLSLTALASLAAMARHSAQHPLIADAPKVCDSCAAWNQPQRPFRVFGNTYDVGTAGLTSVLVSTSEGLILFDGALPQSAPLIDANIRALGFRTEDVKLLFASHAHYDHVGGLHALQAFTGADVAASPLAADALARGTVTADDPQAGIGAEKMAFPPIAHLRRVHDGEVLRVGDTAVTAHFTPGHTPGGTTWTWRSCEGARCLDVVYADSLNAVSADGFRFTGDASHASLEPTFRKSLAIVDALPCDVLLSVDPEFTQTLAKLAARDRAPETNPFVDPGACHAYVSSARAALDARIAAERR